MSSPTARSAPTIARAGVTDPGSFAAADPHTGLEETLDRFVFAEELGFDTVGIRQRHLENGSSSALTLLAAATQRTSSITLETNVVPLGFEVPFRLAEDFLTVSALSGGRVAVGISSSAPHSDLLQPLNRPDFKPDTDPYELLDRFLEALRSFPLHDEPLPTPYGVTDPPAISPRIPDLIDNVWLGAGSDRSVAWAAQRGLAIFLGNISDAVDGLDFENSQRARIDSYRDQFAGTAQPRVAVERVIVPLDSATSQQRDHYQKFAQSRYDRTLTTHGSRKTLIQPDLIGTSEEIIALLANDPVFDGDTELRLALPYAFTAADYEQILADTANLILPELGWSPSHD